jgi:CheY-like chemotaxis protein
VTNKVLILEDSRVQAQVIARMFEKSGFEAVIVFDEPSALEQVRTQSFDLLVLDVFVENANTLDHISEYRDLAPEVPIAIMTAGKLNNPTSGPDALNKARRARIDILLPKPFHFDDIRQICEDLRAGRISSNARAIAS